MWIRVLEVFSSYFKSSGSSSSNWGLVDYGFWFELVMFINWMLRKLGFLLQGHIELYLLLQVNCLSRGLRGETKEFFSYGLKFYLRISWGTKFWTNMASIIFKVVWIRHEDSKLKEKENLDLDCKLEIREIGISYNFLWFTSPKFLTSQVTIFKIQVTIDYLAIILGFIPWPLEIIQKLEEIVEKKIQTSFLLGWETLG